MTDTTASGDVWRARPALARILRSVIFLVPIAASLAATAVYRASVAMPRDMVPKLLWATGLLLCAVVVAVGVERVARRALPLVTLLKLSMLFPDQAPSRFATARAAGSVRKLEAMVAAAGGGGEQAVERQSAATVLALSVSLRTHDRRTRGHSERVRVFTDLLAEELELPEDDMFRLRWAALLHDVGKLTILPKILNKPGALDDAEWALMKRHPIEGARIADSLLDWLGPWANAIVEHHERFDGKGYPNGLAGGSISLGGRIVSVADSYDTMTAARSYKKPMAVWAARRELADCAGGQFDPEVVRAFLSISLPKLLWRTGPVSLFVQLPFLGRLQEVGLQSVTAMTQGVAAATVAAGVTAMIVAGPTGASAHGHHGGPDHAGPTTAGAVLSPSASPSPAPAVPTTPTAPTPSGDPSQGPVPTPTPSTQPTGSETPATSPSPTSTSTPSPTEGPSSTPTPLPVPTVTPLPIPTVPPLPIPSVPPLPLPSLPPLPIARALTILVDARTDVED